MNNKKIYIVLGISLALNLFFLGFVTGKLLCKPDRKFPPHFAEHFVKEAPFGGKHHHHFPGQVPMHKFFKHDHHLQHHDRPLPANGERKDKFPKFRQNQVMRGIICGKVSPEVQDLENEMLEKKHSMFAEAMKKDKAIRKELREEFVKDKLDPVKIKELFTKQTEGFITVQKNAQDVLLEFVSKLPVDKRAEVICSGSRDNDFKKMKHKNHHDGKPKARFKD